MKKCLYYLLLVCFISLSLQEIKLVEGAVDDKAFDLEDNEEVHGDMIKIPERVLNATRGKKNYYLAITGQDFIDLTANSTSKDGFFVFFGTDWCGHCKKFKPQFQDIADKIGEREEGLARPLMIYYQVEKETEHQAKLFRVHGYPSLFYIYNNTYWEYEGKREEEDILEWIDKIRKGQIAEGRPYPDRLPTFVENFKDGLDDTWKLIKVHYKYNFLVFCIIAGCFVLILSLCCLTIHQLLTEDRGDIDPEVLHKKNN